MTVMGSEGVRNVEVIKTHLLHQIITRFQLKWEIRKSGFFKFAHTLMSNLLFIFVGESGF